MTPVAFLGHVVRLPGIHKRAPGRLQNADLILLAMATEVDAHPSFDAVVQMLRDCVRPVLFVPSTAGIFEGSRS